MTTYRIRGNAVDSIADLYSEFNRLAISGEEWQLGPSLDALNDALFRLDAHSSSAGRIRFVWLDHAHSRSALGLATTRSWLLDKLARPEVFNQAHISRQLDALMQGTGSTYFDLVLEVFAQHPTITLELR